MSSAADKMDTTSLLDEDGKNAKQLVCQRCSSKILPPKLGTYEEREFELHQMAKKQQAGGGGGGGEPGASEGNNGEKKMEDTEMVLQFYKVEDMFDFDNVGFTRSVGDVKFLICADCEIGPVGYQKDNLCYVALVRVVHQ